MRAYTLALALFTFGFVVGAINGIAIFDTQLPGTTSTFGEAQVSEMTNESLNGEVSALQQISSIFEMGAVFFEGLKTSLTVMPLLMSYGVPALVAMMIQGPIWMVYMVALVQFVTGRMIKGGE